MKLIFKLDADIDAVRPVYELYDSYEVHECGRGVLAFVCLLFIHGYISIHFFFHRYDFGTYVAPINVYNFD